MSLTIFALNIVKTWFPSARLVSQSCILARHLRPRSSCSSQVHSSVVRAADCRSAGPWLKSGCALTAPWQVFWTPIAHTRAMTRLVTTTEAGILGTTPQRRQWPVRPFPTCFRVPEKWWSETKRVHSSVVRAADCRSAGPWLKSGCALAVPWLVF